MRGNVGQLPLPLRNCSPMLTDPACRNATCPAGKPRQRLAGTGGLYLEIAPTASKRWFANGRF